MRHTSVSRSLSMTNANVRQNQMNRAPSCLRVRLPSLMLLSWCYASHRTRLRTERHNNEREATEEILAIRL
jgi:hypothetical protein